MSDKALVVLSGGQDSMTCLAQAIADCQGHVSAVSFVYGQRHVAEIEAAKKICEDWTIPHIVVDLTSILSGGTSALTDTSLEVGKPHPLMPGVPSSFVPMRNAVFLTIAYGLAMEQGINLIYTGVCETDYSGYPDCRGEFISMLNRTLGIGYPAPGEEILIVAPLMHLNKAQTFKLARDLGDMADQDVLGYIIENSVTCYNGDVTTTHEWGKGCGTCPACELKANGFEEYKSNYRVDA